MNIVIVEDEGITALFLKESIEELGHNIVGIFDNASNLFEFLSEDNNETELIFMDINIKGAMDGIQTSAEISLKYPFVSIVFITSFKDSQTINEAQIVKPLGYIVKPISEVDLETILMIVTANRISTKNAEHKQILLKDYRYEKDTKELFYKENLVRLSKNERQCIDLLFKNHNSYVSNEQLAKYIWTDAEEQKSSLRELLFRLRRKLIAIEIINTPNVGYTLKVIDY